MLTMRGETMQVTTPFGGAGPATAVLPGEGVLPVLPVLPALRPLFPAAGLPRGAVVSADRWGLLCMVLTAAASAAGAWCALVGVPGAGVAAAADAGAEPARMLLAADPGQRWPQVVATLLEGCEMVLLGLPARPPAPVRRKVEATARRFGAVLVVAGDWEGAQLRLTVARQEWLGAGPGHGRLRARRALVVASGRGAAARPRSRWLWLPGPDGLVTAADETAEPVMPDVSWQQAGTG